MPRKAIGDQPMSVAERQARHRVRSEEQRRRMVAALRAIKNRDGVRTLDDAVALAGSALSTDGMYGPKEPTNA